MSTQDHSSPDSNDVISHAIEEAPPAEHPAQEDILDVVQNNTVTFTLAEEKRVLRKIDRRVLPLMLGAYFLQQLDKSSLSYASVFDLQADAHLVGLEYSWLGSILYVAQLVMQPVGALVLVKLPLGKVISVVIFCWGVVLCGMSGCTNWPTLMATRFLLGTFESMIGKSISSSVCNKLCFGYVLMLCWFRSIFNCCHAALVETK